VHMSVYVYVWTCVCVVVDVIMAIVLQRCVQTQQ